MGDIIVDQEEENSTEITTIVNDISDTDLSSPELDVDNSPLDWQFEYSFASDYEVATLSIKNLYLKVYLDMKAHPEGQKFKYFLRHAFANRYKTDGLDCNTTCQSDIICAIVHITKENFKDCLVEQGVIEDLPTK